MVINWKNNRNTQWLIYTYCRKKKPQNVKLLFLSEEFNFTIILEKMPLQTATKTDTTNAKSREFKKWDFCIAPLAPQVFLNKIVLHGIFMENINQIYVQKSHKTSTYSRLTGHGMTILDSAWVIHW